MLKTKAELLRNKADAAYETWEHIKQAMDAMVVAAIDYTPEGQETFQALCKAYERAEAQYRTLVIEWKEAVAKEA